VQPTDAAPVEVSSFAGGTDVGSGWIERVNPAHTDRVVGRARTVEGARAAGTGTGMVPSDVTVGGQDAPAELVDSLVRDALRRSGLAATAEVDTAEGRVRQCLENVKSIVTAAGLSAGIDGALHVIEKLMGSEVAKQVAYEEEYAWTGGK